jgi:hypothetical protein
MTVADGDSGYIKALGGRPYIARKDTSFSYGFRLIDASCIPMVLYSLRR